MLNYIVVGAGLAGCVIAERISSVLKEDVLIIEKKEHIGGHCYDQRNDHNIIIHRYGPHLFHTNNEKVFRYLSSFTEWRNYEHQVCAFVDNRKIPLPFNFNSINMVFPRALALKMKERLLHFFPAGSKIPILELRRQKDELLHQLADYIYEKIFLNYTAKQWEKKPEELLGQVTARVPVLVGDDNRYFSDQFQVVPLQGYHKIFSNMLASQRIKVLLETDFNALIKVDFERKRFFFRNQEFNGTLIFTAMLDELFAFKFGELAYRSLKIETETLPQEYFQEVATVNYPNDYSFTRITEFKHIHPVSTPVTTIMKEYPQPYRKNKNLPFYPLFTAEAQEQYEQYRRLAQSFPNLIAVGRLAEYKYYNMDEVIERALQIFEEKIKRVKTGSF